MMEKSTAPSTEERGALMAIGGAEDKMKARQILRTFLVLAGGERAQIAVVRAASGQAGRVGDLYHALFCDLGAAAVEIIHLDQHFQKRGRTGRLMTAVAYNPSLIGLGIDEDTAVVIDGNNVVEVVGRGAVTIVDGAELTYTNVDQAARHDPVSVTDLRLHVLTAGLRYDLISRSPHFPGKL